MAKRRAKTTLKKPTEPKDPQIQPQFKDLEFEALQMVERQIGAIRAVREVEIERLLTELRLVRSRFDEEQLQKPVLQVFEETLPNLSVVASDEEGNRRFDVRWKERGGSRRISMASFLQRLSSMAFPPPGHSSNAGRTSFLGAENLNFKDIVLEKPSEAQTLEMHEALQTPGVTSQRLSVGMTPKTLRLPKSGEMLLSVHGSPLGIYKENNMEAIHESEEG